MTEFLVEPAPQVVISDADITALPLCHFHMLVLVEPDPESWEATSRAEAQLETICDMIIEEVCEGGDPGVEITPAPDVERTFTLWIGGGATDLFESAVRVVGDVTFLMPLLWSDYEVLDQLGFYLRGIAGEHPDWRVAVVGATLEEDVILVANAVQKIGFSTTVVTRYCLSKQLFLDLEEMVQEVRKHRRRIRRSRLN